MSQTIERTSHKGVICLFCGKSNTLSAVAEQRHMARPDESLASIVRCHVCGKEALYLKQEIVDFQAA